MRLRATVLSVLPILSVMAGDACAATIPLREDITAGPAFAGGGVVWAETRERGGYRQAELRTRAGPIAVPRPVLERGAEVDDEVPEQLVASRTHVALAREVWASTAVPADIVTGRAAGRLRILRSRRPCRPGPVVPASVDLAGSVLAFSSSCAAEARSRVIVRDLARGPAPERVLARSKHRLEVRAAGRLVAWKHALPGGGVIRVFDLDRGRVVRRIRARALGTAEFRTWDLAADGTIAVTYFPRGAAAQRVAWWPARRDGPRRLNLPSPSGSNTELQLARGSIAYLTEVTDLSSANLVVAPLRGGPLRVIAFSARRRQFGQIAFDGRRLAWAEQQIDRRKIDCPSTSYTYIPCSETLFGPRRIVVRRLF